MPEALPAVLKEILRLITRLPAGGDAFDTLPLSLRNKALKQLTALVQRLKREHDLPELLSELAAIAKAIAQNPAAYDGLTTQTRQRLANTLEGTLSELERAAKAISPIKFPQDAFNPFAPQVVGGLIANTLLTQHRELHGISSIQGESGRHRSKEKPSTR